ncbi:ABC transporter ATP-binding protein, partial [Kitasatospora setae]|uniref:ABC transporter ATP-binding protein n=1 Tax=Kitasatospora setae TaxID=2066 RepID=UPI0005267C89
YKRQAPGCAFAPRCPLAEARCHDAEPALAGLEGAQASVLLAAPPAPAAEPLPPAADAHLAACVRAAHLAAVRPAPAEVYPVPALPAAVPGAGDGREPVLVVRGLRRSFAGRRGGVLRRRGGEVHAVDGVDLDVRRGETLGLVGESGSGKSTTLSEILRLAAPQGGRIELLGQDTGTLDRAAVRRLRPRVQMVFQDPAASLDPRMPVGDVLAEPLLAQRVPTAEARRRVPALLRQVGLDPAHADRYPHEFSGGQRQRISIARALAVRPDLLVLDEPVSALDVSVQAGVVNLLQQLKAELGLAYLFVSHDLSVVRHLADRVAVMYLGRTVESGPAADVLGRPRHPYTRALLAAVPLPDPAAERARPRLLLAGDPPSPTARHTGCPFRARCPLHTTLPPARQARCATEPPTAEPGDGHTAACHWSDG